MTDELDRNPLWLILVEAVHQLPMYPSHRAYVRDVLLPESPGLSAEDISARLDISLGEAMVILYELRRETGSDIAKRLGNDQRASAA